MGTTVRAVNSADYRSQPNNLARPKQDGKENPFISFLSSISKDSKPNNINKINNFITKSPDKEENMEDFLIKGEIDNPIAFLEQIISLFNKLDATGQLSKDAQELLSKYKSQKNIDISKFLDNNKSQLANLVQKLTKNNQVASEKILSKEIINIKENISKYLSNNNDTSQETTKDNKINIRDLKGTEWDKPINIKLNTSGKEETSNLTNKIQNQLNILGQYENSDIKMNISKDTPGQLQQILEKNISTTSQNSPDFLGGNFGSDSNTKNFLAMMEKRAEEQKLTQALENSSNKMSPLNSDVKQSTQSNGIKLFTQIHPGRFSTKIFDMAKNMQVGQKQSARLMLKPEYLGTVFVELSISARGARINLKADSKQSQKLIENQIASLKEKLDEIGLKTESINIELSGEENQAGNQSNSSYQMREKRSILQEFLSSFKHLSADSPNESSMQDEIAADNTDV